ncbi:MAG TPA: flagellar protein FliT [Chromatiaceae bacterium]|nr:flagellar protein FliT [Chromatiaceae bacterium]
MPQQVNSPEVLKRGDLPEKILNQSQAMLEQAQLGDWQKVILLAAERDELVHRFFSEDPGAEDSCRVAKILNEVFRINRRVETLTRKGRERMREELQQVQEGQKALRAYREP